jgi:xanthine dehydrogenase YagS FAD-binding subunit
VAHKPWRARDAERALVGHTLDDATLAAAGAAATHGARPYRDNAFKVTLAQRAVVRALREAAQA